jgi:hypothetical protein
LYACLLADAALLGVEKEGLTGKRK